LCVILIPIYIVVLDVTTLLFNIQSIISQKTVVLLSTQYLNFIIATLTGSQSDICHNMRQGNLEWQAGSCWRSSERINIINTHKCPCHWKLGLQRKSVLEQGMLQFTNRGWQSHHICHTVCP